MESKVNTWVSDTRGRIWKRKWRDTGEKELFLYGNIQLPIRSPYSAVLGALQNQNAPDWSYQPPFFLLAGMCLQLLQPSASRSWPVGMEMRGGGDRGSQSKAHEGKRLIEQSRKKTEQGDWKIISDPSEESTVQLGDWFHPNLKQ